MTSQFAAGVVAVLPNLYMVRHGHSATGGTQQSASGQLFATVAKEQNSHANMSLKAARAVLRWHGAVPKGERFAADCHWAFREQLRFFRIVLT